MRIARIETVSNSGEVSALYDAQAGEAYEDGAALLHDVETFPYLALLSPEKGCGKTRTTEVLEQIIADPVRAVCISEAALFRLVEERQPTLILDEAEGLTG